MIPVINSASASTSASASSLQVQFILQQIKFSEIVSVDFLEETSLQPKSKLAMTNGWTGCLMH